MGSTALVSGSPERVRLMGNALEEVGFEIIGADEPARIPELCTGLGPEALDCYIQLPFNVATTPTKLVEATQAFLAGGLLSRFAAATAVLPALRRGATVILVGGHQPPEDLPDDPRARRDLLTVLARAVAGDTASRGVWAAVVGSDHSPADIAAVAQSRGRLRRHDPATYAALAETGSYDDWRREALSLSAPDVRNRSAGPDPEDYDW
jgi:hypothetical protein